MTKLHNFLNVIGYEVHDRGFIELSVYGNTVAEVDHGNENFWLACTFDVISQEVFEIVAEDYVRNNHYRWIHEDFREEQSGKIHWAGKSSYTELEVIEDILEKADAMREGREYDTRVTIPFDITDEQFAEFALAAHRLDITFNQFVERAVRAAIEKHNFNKD